MTYVELTSLLQSYLENSEASFVANIPQIVKQAEFRIADQVRMPDQRLTATGTIAAGVSTFATPADFWEPLSIFIIYTVNSYIPLLQKQESFLKVAFPIPPSVMIPSSVGQPQYYSIKTGAAAGTTITVAPAPAASCDYTLNYIGDPPSIVDTGTSWLGENCPDGLLYGSLLEGYVYMKGEIGLMAVYKDRFETAINTLKVMCEGRQLIDEYRNPPIQVSPQWTPPPARMGG